MERGRNQDRSDYQARRWGRERFTRAAGPAAGYDGSCRAGFASADPKARLEAGNLFSRGVIRKYYNRKTIKDDVDGRSLTSMLAQRTFLMQNYGYAKPSSKALSTRVPHSISLPKKYYEEFFRATSRGVSIFMRNWKRTLLNRQLWLRQRT